jgi:hypothetical protein
MNMCYLIKVNVDRLTLFKRLLTKKNVQYNYMNLCDFLHTHFGHNFKFCISQRP